MKTSTYNTLKIIIASTILILSVSCKKSDSDVATPVNPNETELITTVKLIVSPTSDPEAQAVFAFKDLDGDGGNHPIIDTIRLQANTEYQIQLIVLDETKSPVDTTSNEIEEEKKVHQFFFTQVGTYDLTTTYLDFDDYNVPLGLNIKINTATAFAVKTNKFRVVLKHQPGLKPKTGNGDSSLGETDIDIEFPILIQ